MAMRRARSGLWIALLVACRTAPPVAPWLEEELGQTHARAEDGGAPSAGPSLEQGAEPLADAPGGGGSALDAAARAQLDAVVRALRAVDAGGAPGPLGAALRRSPPATWPALERLAAEASGPGAVHLWMYLGRVWLHAGAHERAAPHLVRARAQLAARRSPDAEVERELAVLESSLAARGALDPRLVAVLLPQSGRFAALGRELARAIALAPAGLAFRVYDTRGEPEHAVAMVDRAAADGAVAILGPVGEREARSAARRAALRGMPIALLAPQDGASAEVGVLRAAWSVEDEARAAADWADANDHRAVAVFAPRDDLGGLAAAAFVERAAARGLRVVKSGQYDAAGGAVEGDVKELLDLVPARNPRLAAHLRRGGKRAWQTFVPTLEFSLLYIPDRPQRAALIAAYLPYFGVELRTEEIMDPVRLARKYRGVIPQVVQLVGGAGWADPTLPARGGAAVQGAMVLDVCSAQRDDVAADAHARLADALGAPPSAAAAQALDAATWMVEALAKAAVPDREAARRALLRARLELGACGPLSFDDRGEAVREPAVLQIDGEDLVLAP